MATQTSKSEVGEEEDHGDFVGHDSSEGHEHDVGLVEATAHGHYLVPGPKIRDTKINDIPYSYSGSFSSVSKPNFASKYY